MATDAESPNKIPHGEILHGDNLPLLKKIASESVSLIYVDPPFNTGRTQSRKRIKVRAVTDEKTPTGLVLATNFTQAKWSAIPGMPIHLPTTSVFCARV